jgi:acyl-ACP thioesterase
MFRDVLTPFPERGRTFKHGHRVGPAEVDPEDAAHLDAIAHWLQDVAFLDVLDADLAEAHSWIVRRTTLAIQRRPVFAEQLSVRTACSGVGGSVAARRTSITGENGARVEAEAIWVQIDPETRLPARLGERFHAVYAESAGGRRASPRLRHPGPPEDAGTVERCPWMFRAADLDLAGHVNNAVYWQLAEQHLAGAAEPGAIEIEYRTGAGPGPATVLRGVEMLWVLDGSGELSASVRRPVP